MQDNPLLQTLFDDFDEKKAVLVKRSIGGVPLARDMETVFNGLAKRHDSTADEVQRWLKEAGKI